MWDGAVEAGGERGAESLGTAAWSIPCPGPAACCKLCSVWGRGRRPGGPLVSERFVSGRAALNLSRGRVSFWVGKRLWGCCYGAAAMGVGLWALHGWALGVAGLNGYRGTPKWKREPGVPGGSEEVFLVLAPKAKATRSCSPGGAASPAAPVPAPDPLRASSAAATNCGASACPARASSGFSAFCHVCGCRARGAEHCSCPVCT